VPLVIRILKVQRQELWHLVRREIEIAKDGVHPLLKRHRAIVVLAVLLGAVPGTLRNLRTRPEECGGQDPLVGSGGPERLPEPELGIMVLHVEVVPRDGVGEVVVDDAVGGGVEAGDDGVVVGEGERGEDGDQALGGGGPIGEEAADVRERGLVLVPEAEAVRGYEQHHGLRELGERPRGDGDRGHDGEGRWRAEQDEGRGGGECHGEEEQEAGGGGALGSGHGGGEESGGGPRRVIGGPELGGVERRRHRRAIFRLLDSGRIGVDWIWVLGEERAAGGCARSPNEEPCLI